MASNQTLIIAFKEATIGECGWMDIPMLCERFKAAGKPSSSTYVRQAIAAARAVGRLEEKTSEKDPTHHGRQRMLYRFISPARVMKAETPPPVAEEAMVANTATDANLSFDREPCSRPMSFKELGDMYLGEIVSPPEEIYYDRFKAAVPDKGIVFRSDGARPDDEFLILPRHEIMRRALAEQQLAYVQPVPVSELELESLVRHYAR